MIKFFIVSYKECRDMVVDNLSEEERESLVCYAVNQKYDKRITDKIRTINEWDLEWFDSCYQDLQYYEYSLLPHIVNNEELITDYSHIGLFHFDTVFNPNSVNDIRNEFLKNPQQILCMQIITDRRSLYMSKDQLDNICLYLSNKLKIFINPEYIWNFGWISHAMIIAPKEVFIKFGNFMINNHEEIEDIIRSKRWGLRGHRTCGLVERMWGFYLVSLGIPYKKITSIIHDGAPYEHDAWNGDIKTFKL